MNLSEELKNLSEKINFYSNLLSKKTEQINYIDIKNKKEKLEKWSICKKKLKNKLKFIDNKLNRFIKDSNNCISNITSDTEFNLYKKFLFGTESDDGDRGDGSDGSDDYSQGIVDVGADITGITHSTDLFNRKFYEKVIKEFDVEDYDTNKKKYIHKKLYNCLLYGTFFLVITKFSSLALSSLQMQPGQRLQPGYSYSEEIKESKRILDLFLTALKNNKAYLAGGYINMAINYPVSKYISQTDVDIYINKRDFKEFLTNIQDIFTIMYYNYDIASPYMESFFKKNGLLSRFIITLKNNIKLDILIIRDDYKLTDVIKNFDLTYCSVYLDPNGLTHKKFKIEGEVDAMLEKSGKLNDEYAQKYLFNNFIQNRIKKYSNRGYKTLIDAHINVVMERKSRRVVNEPVLVNKLLKKMYEKYKTIVSLQDLIYTISILDYTKTRIIECAKIISTKLYNTDKYYYYILINLLAILEDDFYYVRERFAESSANYENFQKLQKEFKNELITTARKNNEFEFTEKPTNNNSIIKLLDYDKIKSVLSSFKAGFNIDKKLIDELLKISNDNPNADFNKILLKSSNDFFSNPKYTNLITTLLYNNRGLASPDKIVFNDYWFLQNKPFTTTLLNIVYFKDEITQYTNSEINFREIMYYDLYQYEEITFDEVYKNDDNLLFILEDTKKGFTYNFETLTTPTLLEFILECTQDVLSAPTLAQLKSKNKWYSQLSSPYNIGILVGQLYQAYSLYENSNKEIRKFIFGSSENLNHVSNIKAIQWGDNNGRNIWDEQIDLVGQTHCGSGMTVYNKVFYEL